MVQPSSWLRSWLILTVPLQDYNKAIKFQVGSGLAKKSSRRLNYPKTSRSTEVRSNQSVLKLALVAR